MKDNTMKKILKTSGSEIYYEVTGKGPALIFSHGLGGNYLSWWQQIPYFSQHFTCITYSHRGFWPNAVPAEIPHLSVFEDDLSALIDHLGLESVTLIAQSFGGWICMEYARRFPSRVHALIFASTAGTLNYSAIQHAEIERLNEWKERSDLEKKRIQKIGVAPGAGSRMAEEQPSLHYLYRHFNEMTPSPYRDSLRTIIHNSRILAPEKFAEMNLPMLFLAGNEDLLFPPGAAVAAASIHPGIEYELLPQTGHSAYFERAQLFNRSVEKYLASLHADVVPVINR